MGGGWRYPTRTAPFPVPTQQRAAETVRAAIDATVWLLERFTEDQVTLEAVRQRSGVSQGSLTHHFGGREGLLATAHVERYSRSVAADAQFLGVFAGALEDRESFAAVMLGMIGDMLSPERREVRWLRMSAIAAAFGDPLLTETISDRYTALADHLTSVVDIAPEHGILEPDVDVRTVALLVSMHAQGLVLDDIAGTEVSPHAWSRLLVEFVSAFLTPEATAVLRRQEQERFGDLWRADVFGRIGRLPQEVEDRLTKLQQVISRTDPDAAVGPQAMTDHASVARMLLASTKVEADTRRSASGRTVEARERLLAETVRALREHGQSGVDTTRLRTVAGISPQAFHRMFGTRDGLIREARVRLEVARSARSIARFATLLEQASCPAEVREALEVDAVKMSEEASRGAMWQRMETLAACRTDQALRDELAELQQRTRDLLIEQVCLAQARGLIDPGLPCRGVARLLDGTVFWHVFHGLDEKRPARDEWTADLRRVAAMVSPDQER